MSEGGDEEIESNSIQQEEQRPLIYSPGSNTETICQYLFKRNENIPQLLVENHGEILKKSSELGSEKEDLSACLASPYEESGDEDDFLGLDPAQPYIKTPGSSSSEEKIPQKENISNENIPRLVGEIHKPEQIFKYRMSEIKEETQEDTPEAHRRGRGGPFTARQPEFVALVPTERTQTIFKKESNTTIFRPRINKSSHKIQRKTSDLFAWEQKVKLQKENKIKENNENMERQMEQSKLSTGSKKLILASSRSRYSKECRSKSNLHLISNNIKDISFSTQRKITPFSKPTGKPVLPNCIFYSAREKKAFNFQKEYKFPAKVANVKSAKGFLSGSILERTQIFLENKRRKIEKMAKEKKKKEMCGCTFFPKFFTKP